MCFDPIFFIRRQPWCSYALHMATFNPPALITDSLLVYLLYKATQSYQWILVLALWMVFTKTVKLLPHFFLYPQDLIYLPVSILFGYFHGVIKLYALCTLDDVSGFPSKKKNVSTHRHKFLANIYIRPPGEVARELTKTTNIMSIQPLLTAILKVDITSTKKFTFSNSLMK